jgi:outer membrane protein assembly factor BamB
MALTPSAAAADTMFRADLQHTGVFDNNGIVPTNTELWRFATGSAVISSPTVSNGVVSAGSRDTNLYAIDAVTGKWATISSYSTMDLSRSLDTIKKCKRNAVIS